MTAFRSAKRPIKMTFGILCALSLLISNSSSVR